MKYKVGIVGVRRGGSYMRHFGRSTRSEITALCDLKEESLAACAEEMGLPEEACYTDYEAFLDSGIDIVVVSTPIPFHEEQVVRALEKGKHVFSEVTMANTLEGCARIREAAKRSGGTYMMAENYIFFHFIQEWKKNVEAGCIGRIHYAEAEYIHTIRDLLVDTSSGETFWRTYRPPIHYCSHCLGPLMTLIGNGDYIVKATASGNKNTMLTDFWPSTIDIQVALFETKQGRGIKIARSQVTPVPEPHTVYYSVYGTKGFLENGRRHHESVGHRYFEGIDEKTVPINCYQTDVFAAEYAKKSHGTSDYMIANYFLDCLDFGRTPLLNEDFAYELTIPGIIAHEAACHGNVWLDVPHFE